MTFSPADVIFETIPGETDVAVVAPVYGPLFSITEQIENGQSVCIKIVDDSFTVPGLIPPTELYSRAAVRLYAALLCQTLEDTGH